MFSEKLHFIQRIPTAGFRWVRIADLKLSDPIPSEDQNVLSNDPVEPSLVSDLVDVWALAENEPKPGCDEYRECDIDADDPALFLKFGELESHDPAKVLEFANKYGRMGTDWSWKAEGNTEGLLRDGWDRLCVEPQLSWVRQSQEIKAAISLFNLIRKRDIGEISRRIEKSHRSLSDTEARRLTRELIEHEKAWKQKLKDDHAVFPPKLAALQECRHIVSHDGKPTNDPPLKVAEGYLKRLVTHGLWDGTYLEMGSEATNGPTRVLVRPKHLIGLIWLQLARAMATDRKYTACKHCHGLFEALITQRKKKEFCSISCKLKAYRSRKKDREEGEHEPSSTKEKPTNRTTKKKG